MSTESNATTAPTPAPLRCHWCGGETELWVVVHNHQVRCRDSDCDYRGPRRDTPEAAILAHQAVAPAMRWTSEPPMACGEDDKTIYYLCERTWDDGSKSVHFYTQEPGYPRPRSHASLRFCVIPEPIEPDGKAADS